jgi:hypothetical protein
LSSTLNSYTEPRTAIGMGGPVRSISAMGASAPFAGTGRLSDIRAAALRVHPCQSASGTLRCRCSRLSRNAGRARTGALPGERRGSSASRASPAVLRQDGPGHLTCFSCSDGCQRIEIGLWTSTRRRAGILILYDYTNTVGSASSGKARAARPFPARTARPGQ